MSIDVLNSPPIRWFPVEVSERINPEPSTAALAAVAQVAVGVPGIITALQMSAQAGTTFRIAFSPETMAMYADGAARLMESSNAARSIMVSVETGQILEHGSVVAQAAEHATLGATALLALPALVAAAATYAQQRRMEQALDAIQKACESLIQRALDTENGVCIAAENFAQQAARAIQTEGQLGPYLRHELALHRQAVAAVHEARQLYIDRFDRELTAAQNEREAKKGESHPWVQYVVDKMSSERLIDELELYAMSLVTDVRLGLLSAQAMLEDGAHALTVSLAEEISRRFRERFYAFFRRIRPLGEIAPQQRIWDKLPFVGETEARAFAVLQQLVERMKLSVEPLIPPEAHDRDAFIDIGPQAAGAVLRLVEAA